MLMSRPVRARRSTLFVLCIAAACLVFAAIAPASNAAFGFKSKTGTNGGVGSLGLGDGEFVNPYATAIGPSNNIYVLEYKDCSVRIHTPSGGFIRRFGGPCTNPFGPSAAGMYQPVAIDVAMNGDIYIADQYLGRVQVFDGFGNLLRSIGNSGPMANRLYGATGVVVTPMSAMPDVFVVEGSNQRIAKYNNAGDFQWARGRDVLATDGDTGSEFCNVAADCKGGVTGSVNGAFWQPMSIDIDSTATNLWVAERGNERVQKLDASNGAHISAFPAQYASAASYDETSGKVWVSNGITHRVYRFDGAGVSDRTLGTGSGTNADGDLAYPGKPAVTASGGVIVADFGLHRVQGFTEAGAFDFKFGKNGGLGEQSGSGNGEFNLVGDVLETGGKIWASDLNNNRIQRFTSAGAFEAKVPETSGAGVTGGRFNYPNGVAVDLSGNIWVADMGNHRIQKFDSTGVFLLAFGYDVLSGAPTAAGEICSVAASCKAGVSGNANSQFFAPIDLAFSPLNGDLYVVEQNTHRVQRFDETTLAHVATIGGPTPTTFGTPQAIAFDAAGNYFVTDYNSLRVRKLDATDALTQNLPLDGSDGTNGHPVGVAVLGNGEIHVVQGPTNNVKVFAADGTTVVRRYGEIGSSNGQFYNPMKIAAGAAADEAIVADAGNHRFQRFGDTTLATPAITITQPAAPTSTHADHVLLTYVATDSTGATPTCYPGNGTLYPLVEGLNPITVECTDPFGPEFSATVNVTRIIDTTAPDVVISSPLDGATVSTASVNVAYTTSDDSGETPVCDIASGASVALTPGPNTITVSCDDNYGNTGTASVTITYSPPVTVTPPATVPQPGATTPGAPVLTMVLTKKQKFKGKIAANVACDIACNVVLTAKVKVGGKTYSATSSVAGIAGGAVAARVSFKAKQVKAIRKALKNGKKLTAQLTVTASNSYGATTGKSGSVKLAK